MALNLSLIRLITRQLVLWCKETGYSQEKLVNFGNIANIWTGISMSHYQNAEWNLSMCLDKNEYSCLNLKYGHKLRWFCAGVRSSLLDIFIGYKCIVAHDLVA